MEIRPRFPSEIFHRWRPKLPWHTKFGCLGYRGAGAYDKVTHIEVHLRWTVIASVIT